MKIIILTNYNSWISKKVIEAIYEDNNISIQRVIFYKNTNIGKLFNRLKSYDKRKAILKIIRYLLNLIGINTESTITSLNFVKENKIKYLVTKNINSDENLKIIEKINPDIVLICSFSQIVKGKFLRVCKNVLNIHDSLLPKYKGPSPTFWALYNNEKESGYTIHQVEKKIDTGAIVYQKRIVINYDEIFDEEKYVDIVFTKVSEDICFVLKEFLKGNLAIQENEPLRDSYFSFPTKKQRIELIKRLRNK